MQRAVRITVGSLAVGALLYLGDWGVWRVRVAGGGGVGRVMVSRFVVAPLKGGREEYYGDGSGAVECSHSLFPQAGRDACWWLKRHAVVYER